MSAPRKLSILFRTSEFRGDHSADATIIVDPMPGETVEQLADRIFGGSAVPWQVGPADHIEIRVVWEPKP